ncbi:MAG: membrane protein insertase YidC [Nannocystaceae bacterium]
MDSSRRTLLAIVICVLIWIAYQTWIMPPPPLEESGPDAQAQQQQREPSDGASEGQGDREDEAPKDVAGAAHGQLRNDLLALDVTNFGGVVSGVGLLSPQFLDAEGKGLDFLDLDGRATLSVGFDYDDESGEFFRLKNNAPWEVLEPKGDNQVWNLRLIEPGVELTASLTLLEGYEARYVVKVKNTGDQAMKHRMVLQSRLGEGAEKSSYNVHRGLCASTEDVEDFDMGDVDEHSERVRGSIRWMGLDTKYFLSAVIPAEYAETCEIRATRDQSALVGKLYHKAVRLDPGEARTYEYGVYLGTKELERLRTNSVVGGVSLEDSIDWGWFGSLSSALGKLMLRLLRWFYQLTGIWGVAIILLTVVVKVVTLPLTFKQMNSMKRMKEIQPEIEALKTKYADDRTRQAQEMQALFARSGVNPLAGCLPMLVQLPIWIALYAMLATAVELFRVPFLWLPDLTQQDPYYITPLLIGGLMFLQTRLQPTPTADNQQARMMMWMMPTIFTVMMLFLPSGLGVYIFANILLSLIQTVVQTRISPPAAAAAKR